MVSEEEVKRRVREAFLKYTLIEELLPEIGEFYHDFRVLHAQLREGDRLEIRIETKHDREDERWWRVPSVTAYLVPKEGKEKKVLDFSTREVGVTREILLYND